LLIRRYYRRKRWDLYFRGFWRKYRRVDYLKKTVKTPARDYLRAALFLLGSSYSQWRSSRRPRPNFFFDDPAYKMGDLRKQYLKQLKQQQLIQLRLTRKVFILRLALNDLGKMLQWTRKKRQRKRFTPNFLKSVRMLVYIPIFFWRTLKPKKRKRYYKFRILKRRDLQFLYFNNIAKIK